MNNRIKQKFKTNTFQLSSPSIGIGLKNKTKQISASLIQLEKYKMFITMSFGIIACACVCMWLCGRPYRLKMAAEVLQTCEALVAGLAGVWPLPRVTAQVSLQVCLPLHRVRTEGALEAHGGVGICGVRQRLLRNCCLSCLLSE